MNGKEMIDTAIASINTYGQAVLLSNKGEIVVLTDWRACAGDSVQFSTLRVYIADVVQTGTIKVDEDKMYEMFRSVA